MNSSILGTAITVGGIAAIALTSTNDEARTAAIGAIAGLSTPLAQVIRASPRRRAAKFYEGPSRFDPVFSETVPDGK